MLLESWSARAAATRQRRSEQAILAVARQLFAVSSYDEVTRPCPFSSAGNCLQPLRHQGHDRCQPSRPLDGRPPAGGRRRRYGRRVARRGGGPQSLSPPRPADRRRAGVGRGVPFGVIGQGQRAKQATDPADPGSSSRYQGRCARSSLPPKTENNFGTGPTPATWAVAAPRFLPHGCSPGTSERWPAQPSSPTSCATGLSGDARPRSKTSLIAAGALLAAAPQVTGPPWPFDADGRPR